MTVVGETSVLMDVNVASGVGENGTLEFTASEVGDNLLAFFFALVRSLPDERMYDLFQACVEEARDSNEAAMEDLFVLAFQTRDCRGGKGERALFLKMLVLLHNHRPHAVLTMLPLVVEYGYFKDYMTLLERDLLPAQLQDAIISILAMQAHKDMADLAANPQASLSLCAKYLPREGGSFDKHHKTLFHALVMAIFPNHSLLAAKVAYRKAVARLTHRLDVPELKMAGKCFADINFEKVPSSCLKRCRKAFLNELCKKQRLLDHEQATGNRHPTDDDRVACRKNLLQLVKNKPEKLKAKQLFAHEVVKTFMSSSPSTAEAELLEAQWGVIRQNVIDQIAAAAAAASPSTGTKLTSLGRLVPLVDVSGSMSGDPMLVAITLGILVSEINHPAFRDRFITFESKPSWVSLADCLTLHAKVDKTRHAPWGGSTNIEAAFDLIADVVEQAGLSPEEIPDLIIFSDMQFDTAAGRNSDTQLDRIKSRFHELGMRMCGKPWPAPRIIFWNLRGDTCGFPAKADSSNVQMLSGFSASMLKAVLEGDAIPEEEAPPTPAETLQKVLSDKRYEEVRKVYRSACKE